MSQSLLHHTFGVREGYEYQKTEYVEGRVEFHLRVENMTLLGMRLSGITFSPNSLSFV